MKIREFFSEGREVVTASAPGRLDVMGGIADYSGSLLLQMPIKERSTVYMAEREDDILNIHTVLHASKPNIETPVRLMLSDIKNTDGRFDFTLLKEKLGGNKATRWALYIIGGLLLLANEQRAALKGVDIWVDSRVPVGKGVSSSAAIEVATLAAAASLLNIDFKEYELPMLAQKVENGIVGAACGLMDQLATWRGKAAHLLPIICQPAETYSPIKIPQGLYIVGIDSGIEHDVAGRAYSDVRTAAFMGYTIIASQEGAGAKDMRHAKKSGDKHLLPFKGYLSNISSSRFEKKYAHLLPDKMKGRDFINKYTDTIDGATVIDPRSEYRIKTATEHPIFENERVMRFKELMEGWNNPQTERKKLEMFEEMGKLMFASHESYTQCGLGHSRTDEIVERVKRAGSKSGLFGAKITGGGSGGTVCILAEGIEGVKEAKQIAKDMSIQHKTQNYFFEGSSEGGSYLPAQTRKV